MPEATQALSWCANLIAGENEGLILYSPGSKEDLPVIGPCTLRESGRQSDHVGSLEGENAKELGKAQVVADGKP